MATSEWTCPIRHSPFAIRYSLLTFKNNNKRS
jgi:hypothetical protein